MRKKLLLYARKSRIKKNEMSLEAQVELLIKYCNDHDYDYVIYSEEGSSENWERPEFQKMMEEGKKGAYAGVLVTVTDRISRKGLVWYSFVEYCLDYGLLLFTLDKIYDFTNDDDILVTGIQSEMNSLFMRVTKKKLKRGVELAVQKGIYMGTVPFGYTKDKSKHLIPDPVTAPAVEKMFEMFLAGYNQVQIAEHLNNRGFKTIDGNIFTNVAVGDILKNITYTGSILWNGIFVADAHPALVDVETFNKVKAIKDRQKAPAEYKKASYPLTGLLKCHECGQTLSLKRDTKNRKVYVSNCLRSAVSRSEAKLNKVKCTTKGCDTARILPMVCDALKKHVISIDEQIEAVLSDTNMLIDEIATEMEQLEHRKAELIKQKQRIQKGFIAGILSEDEAKEEKKDCEIQIKSVENEILILKNKDVKGEVSKLEKVKMTIEQLLTGDLKNEDSNRLLKSIIDHIDYKKTERDNYNHKDPNKRYAPVELTIYYK